MTIPNSVVLGLAHPTWKHLRLVAGTVHELMLTDPTATGTQRFYRVRQW